MNETKIEFHYFTIADFEKEQECLQNHHKSGWRFVKFIFPGFYVFEKCEPENVIYQLDFNAEDSKNRHEYLQMFRDCGWEYLCDVAGWSYFRKSVSKTGEVEEIFSDIESKIAMLERTFRIRMVPLIIIFTTIILPQLFMQHGLHSSGNRILFVMFVILYVLYLIIFTAVGAGFYRLKQKYGK